MKIEELNSNYSFLDMINDYNNMITYHSCWEYMQPPQWRILLIYVWLG